MASYTPTASTVVPVLTPSPQITTGFSGGTIAAGDIVYLDTSTNTYKQAAAGALATAKPAGMALNSASANQPLQVLTSGQVTITVSATPTARTPMALSNTAGKMCDVADLITNIATWFPATLGIWISTTVFQLDINWTGV